jgi:hypothetical protein
MFVSAQTLDPQQLSMTTQTDSGHQIEISI